MLGAREERWLRSASGDMTENARLRTANGNNTVSIETPIGRMMAVKSFVGPTLSMGDLKGHRKGDTTLGIERKENVMKIKGPAPFACPIPELVK